MKKCTVCMTEAPDETVFCPQCGSILNASPNQDAAWNPAAATPVLHALDSQPASYAPPDANPVTPYADPAASPYAPPASPYTPPAPPMSQAPAPYAQVPSPYAQTPYTQAPVGAPAMPAKSKMPRIIGITAASLVLVGAIVAAIIFVFPSPEAKAKKAMAATRAALETQTEYLETVSGLKAMEAMQTKPSSTELFVDLSKTVPGAPSGLQMTFNAYVDPEGKQANIHFNGETTISGQLFWDETRSAIEIPKLLDYAIYFDNETLIQKIEDGTLTDTFYTPPDYSDWDYGYDFESDFDDGWDDSWDDGWDDPVPTNEPMSVLSRSIDVYPGNFAGQTGSYLNGLLSGEVNYAQLEEKFLTAYETLMATGEYQDTGKGRVDGLSQELDTITVTYPSEAVDAFINEILGMYRDLLVGEGINPADLPMPVLSQSRFTQVLYIQDGSVLGVKNDFAFTADESPADFTITLTTADPATPLSDCTLTFKNNRGGREKFTLTGKGLVDAENGIDYTVSTNIDGKEFIFDLEYFPEKAGDNLVVTVESPATPDSYIGAIKFQVNGRYQATEASLDLTLSQLQYSALGQSETFPLDIKLSAKTTDSYQGNPIPDNAKDGFAITPEEWQTYLQEAQMLLMENLLYSGLY